MAAFHLSGHKMGSQGLRRMPQIEVGRLVMVAAMLFRGME